MSIKGITLQTVITDQLGKRVTDHKALVIETCVTVASRGPGNWKFNNSHLNDNEYCNGIEDIIGCIETDKGLENMTTCIKWDIL